MTQLDEHRANWITAAGEAFTAIRLVTGYGRRMAQPLDQDTAYAVTQLADMLHNIGAFATGDGWSSTSFHTPESLERVRASTRALEQRYHDGLPVLRNRDFYHEKPRLIARMVQRITGNRRGITHPGRVHR